MEDEVQAAAEHARRATQDRAAGPAAYPPHSADQRDLRQKLHVGLLHHAAVDYCGRAVSTIQDHD